MSYEAWRTGYQSDEQAGRAAYNAWKRAVAEGDATVAAAKVFVDIGLEIEAELTVARAKLEAAEAHIAALQAELDEAKQWAGSAQYLAELEGAIKAHGMDVCENDTEYGPFPLLLVWSGTIAPVAPPEVQS